MDDDDLYDKYTDVKDEEVRDQKADNNDTNSRDSVEEVDELEEMGAKVIKSDYESEYLYNIDVVSNEFESNDDDNVEDLIL